MNLFPPRILRALQQRIFGLQLGQLPAQAVDFVLQLLVVFNDMNHFIIGLIQALGGTVPAKKHSCREKKNSDQSFTTKPKLMSNYNLAIKQHKTISSSSLYSCYLS